MNNVETIFIDKNKYNTNPTYYTDLITRISPFDTFEVEDIRKEMQNQTYFCIVLEDGDVASICRIHQFDDGIYVNRPIVTDERYKEKGYATKCLLECEKYLRRIGGKKLISFIDIGNKASWKLHLKAGYQRVFNDTNYRDDRFCWDTAVVYEKRLIKQQLKENNYTDEQHDVCTK